MKINVPMRELTDADVRWISLVDRGANRIPFRIIKRDEPSKEHSMGIDLSKLGLGRVSKSEKVTKATITAVVLSKNDQALVDQVRTVLKAEGLDFPKTKEFKDGTVALMTSDSGMETGVIVRLNDNVAVVTSGDMPKDERGYQDGLHAAVQKLEAQVYETLAKSDSTTNDLDKVLTGFRSYVTSLSNAVPESVFKIDQPLAELVSKWGKKPKADAEDAVDGGADEAMEDDEGKMKAKKGEPAKDPKAKDAKLEDNPKGDNMAAATDTGAKEPASEVAKDKATSMTKADLEPMMKAIEALTLKVGAVSDSVSKVTNELGAVKKSTEERLAEVSRKSEDALKVVKSAVVSSDLAGDTEQKTVKKQDDDPRSGLFDTAMFARSR